MPNPGVLLDGRERLLDLLLGTLRLHNGAPEIPAAVCAANGGREGVPRELVVHKGLHGRPGRRVQAQKAAADQVAARVVYGDNGKRQKLVAQLQNALCCTARGRCPFEAGVDEPGQDLVRVGPLNVSLGQQ